MAVKQNVNGLIKIKRINNVLEGTGVEYETPTVNYREKWREDLRNSTADIGGYDRAYFEVAQALSSTPDMIGIDLSSGEDETVFCRRWQNGDVEIIDANHPEYDFLVGMCQARQAVEDENQYRVDTYQTGTKSG